jgi:hypothetical protein
MNSSSSSSESSSNYKTDKERFPDILNVDAARDRFTGYTLTMMILDDTGPTYILMPIDPSRTHTHPNFYISPPSNAGDSPILPF